MNSRLSPLAISCKNCYILYTMRYAIIADIHANLAAFTAVLDDIVQRGGVKAVWCLGDVVGYGPDPRQCIELLRQCNHVCVAGNHDLAAIGKIETSYFNPGAAAACHWTAEQLSPQDMEYLEDLPLVIEKDDFTLVHGSPREPVWEYILSPSVAGENFAFLKSKFCLVGHSHMPLVFKQDEDDYHAAKFRPETWLALGEYRLIINPGGVGQPRDGDPRASYAIYDSEASMIRLYRIAYDIEATQSKMMEAGLPIRLVSRLKHGM
ncbi:metallophosphoesterase family protein [Chloroflexota bacterium]